MAQHILTTGEVQEIKPQNGAFFKLHELNEFVGGYIELVYLSDNRLMVVNEEGKLMGLPVNIKATREVVMSGINDVIVGDVLICDDSQIL